MSITQIVGPRIKPLWADPVEWTSTRSYEAFMFVTYHGDSYCTRQDTPIGIQITNDDYWVKVSDYNAQAVALQRSVNNTLEANETAVQNMITKGQQNIEESVNHVDSVANGLKSSTDQIKTNSEQIKVNSDKINGTSKAFTYRKRSILVAHQGSATMTPPQTLAGYMAAIMYGADALECDPQLTLDNVLVCAHDADTSIVSNHDPILVYGNSTWSELSTVIIDKSNEAQFFEAQHIMRFDDLCALCNRYGKSIVVDDRAGTATQGITAYYTKIKEVLDSYDLTNHAYMLANNFASVDTIQSIFPSTTPIYVAGNGNEANYIEAKNRGIGIAFNIHNLDDVKLQQRYQLPADLWTLDDPLTIDVPHDLLTTDNPFMFAPSVNSSDDFSFKTSYSIPVEFSKFAYETFGFFPYSTIQKETGIYPVHNIQYGVSELVHESDGYNHFLHCMVNDGYKDYKYALNGNKPSGSTWLDSGWKTNESYFVINNADFEIEPIQFRVKMQYGNYGIAHKNGHVSVNELNLCMASMTGGKIVNGPSHYCCFPYLRFSKGEINLPILSDNTREWQWQVIDIANDGTQIKSSNWTNITTDGINAAASTYSNCVRRFMQFRVVPNVLDDADIKNLIDMIPYLFNEKELIH